MEQCERQRDREAGHVTQTVSSFQSDLGLTGAVLELCLTPLAEQFLHAEEQIQRKHGSV